MKSTGENFCVMMCLIFRIKNIKPSGVNALADLLFDKRTIFEISCILEKIYIFSLLQTNLKLGDMLDFSGKPACSEHQKN